MGKNKFLNELIFEIQKMTTTKMIKGGGNPQEEEEETNVAIAIDIVESSSSSNPLTSTPITSTQSNTITSSIPASNLISQFPNISSFINQSNELSTTLSKYLTDTSIMTHEELKKAGFTQQQISSIQNLQEKYKPKEKEILKGDIILGDQVDEGTIVLNRETLNYLGSRMDLVSKKTENTEAITNDDITIKG